MLLYWCQHRDTEEVGRTVPPVAICLLRFLTTVALWPWPVPYTTENMTTLCMQGGRLQHLRALANSVGQHLMTSFIVPLVCGRREWNMTQSVQHFQHDAICAEAWRMVCGCEVAPYIDLRLELRSEPRHGCTCPGWGVRRRRLC